MSLHLNEDNTHLSVKKFRQNPESVIKLDWLDFEKKSWTITLLLQLFIARRNVWKKLDRNTMVEDSKVDGFWVSLRLFIIISRPESKSFFSLFCN